MGDFGRSFWTLIAMLLLTAASQAQSNTVGQFGMLMDPPAVVVELLRGELRPLPAETPVADPNATMPSASIMDIQGAKGVKFSLEPQSLPEEPK